MRLRRLVLHAVPLGLFVAAIVPGYPWPLRLVPIALLLAFWTLVYIRYRRAGRAQTAHEYQQLRDVRWDAFWGHYNERDPTVEEEFSIWGPYHQHRHEMRYDLVAADVRRALPVRGRVLDLGCGSALVADRIADLEVDYVGFDFGHRHIVYAKDKYAERSGPMRTFFTRGDGAKLPFADASFDVVVMSEVIEHLIRPELAVWEIARVLRPGGVFVMTTNNASEVPLRSPVTHLFPWLEKAFGASAPRLISLRPWVWPEPVDPVILPAGTPPVHLPHTHHIAAETSKMFAAAGLDTVRWSTFEFPPPHSRWAARLEARGERGRRSVDRIEAIAHATPLLRRLGTHVFIVARKNRDVAGPPPPGVWPGPFSGVGAPEMPS